MRALIALVVLLVAQSAWGQSSALDNTPQVLYFDIPSETLTLVSQDYPISITFERTTLPKPLLKFSLANPAQGVPLEDLVTQEGGKFVFSAANVSPAPSSFDAVSASSQTTVGVSLCVGLLTLVFAQQHRKLAVVLAISFVIILCSANTSPVYQVTIQIPAREDFPFDGINIQGNGGGSLISSVEFSPRELFVNFCTGASSQVSLLDFHASEQVSICATMVDIQGVFEDDILCDVSGDIVSLRMTNEFAGRLEFDTESMDTVGVEYCDLSSQVILCGEHSGYIHVNAQTSVWHVNPENVTNPAPVAPIPGPGSNPAPAPAPVPVPVPVPEDPTASASSTPSTTPSVSVEASSVETSPAPVPTSTATSSSAATVTAVADSTSSTASSTSSPMASPAGVSVTSTSTASLSPLPSSGVEQSVVPTATPSSSVTIRASSTASSTTSSTGITTAPVASATSSASTTLSPVPLPSATSSASTSTIPLPSSSSSSSVEASSSAVPSLSASVSRAAPTSSSSPSRTASSSVSVSGTSTSSDSVTPTPSSTPSGSSSSSGTRSPTSSSSPSRTASSSVSPSLTPSPSSVPNLFPNSDPNGFLQARRLDVRRPTNGENPVMARSYNGYDWEPVPDQDFDPVSLDCTSWPGSCAILDSGNYAIESVAIPAELLNPEADARWSRMLLQSTFGVSKAELDSIVDTYGNNYQQWILDQMELPVSSHRDYYRKRVNPRRQAGTSAGALFEPCEEGSRYHRYVFNKLDEARVLFVHNDQVANRLTLRVDGQLRGEVSDFNGILPSNASVTWPMQFSICSVEETVGGVVMLGNIGNSTCTVAYTQPNIFFSSGGSNIQSISAGQAEFVPVSGMEGAIVLQSISLRCNLPSANSFVRYAGDHYRFDPRIKFVRNTVDTPHQAQSENSESCPAVIKTFLNEEGCLRAPSCAPLTFTSTSMELNEENIRAWYEDDRIYVYEIRDLTLEEPFNVSPCSGTSRWVYSTGTCDSATVFNDTVTYNTLRDTLSNSTDPNPMMRDITLQGDNCTPYAYTIGAQIQIGTQCFTHVHPDLHNVYDFSYWVINHDGNESAFKNGRPNPIARWAELGLTYLEFPWHHPMGRWAARKQYFTLAGRKGDFVTFNSLATSFQTQSMAERVGALGTRSDLEFSEACGSPSEIENEPALGDRYHLVDALNRDLRTHLLDQYSNQGKGKQTVWYNVILDASDHLRQRVGWALSQIIPVSEVDQNAAEYTESWTSYYDIFVRNAFGNYRDILREVSYSPMMARYLSFWNNRAYSRSGSYPDENYAREIMQLFSVGLWVLNDDGSVVEDEQGNPIATYTNEDILDFARLWTGFDDQAARGNMEQFQNTRNGIDPMQIKPDNRDLLPKAKLDAGYLGDRYPDCYKLPAHHWLKKGATYVFTGESSVEGPEMDAELPDQSGFTGRFTPSPTSPLYQALCSPGEDDSCTFPSKVVLNEDLACESSECESQMIISVKIVDSTDNSTVRYYTYQSVPCVRMTFFGEGKKTQLNNDRLQCADPTQPVGRPICCKATSLGSPLNYVSNQTCLFANEAMDWDTAGERCQSIGHRMCDTTWGGGWTRSCADGQFLWVNSTCTLSLQVYPSGRVGIVDPIGQLNNYPDFNIIKESSNNLFRVRWEGDKYPDAEKGCPAACEEVTTIVGQSCLCNYTLTNSVVYTDIDSLPTREQVLSALFQGTVNPVEQQDYTLCQSCTFPEGVRVWLSASGELDEQSIFEVAPTLAGGRTYYLLNTMSRVSVGSFGFRNPPRFMQGAGELNYRWRSWNPVALLIPPATNEVEDLLDHLFEHQSTAPFVAYRLIQRLVTSNPSPRYMKSVVKAFRTGEYNGVTYSGRYGDLAATVAAVLLDREARTAMVEADPTFGVMREPMVKLIQVFNSLEFSDVSERETMFHRSIYDRVGMEPYHSPSVFGFYLPENRPEGPINDIGIVSPESQLAITPNLFGLLNGLVSLIDYGFSPCSFADQTVYANCRYPERYLQGTLNYTPDNITDATAVVDELDLLLTGKRLSGSFKQHIIDRYNETMVTESAEEALKLAQKLILLSPEYHVTNAHKSSVDEERPALEEIPSQGRDYKAIVIIIQGGGADSFSLFAPHSNCGAFDLNAEYEEVRQGAKIDKSSLLPINVPSGTQPCDTFGVHPSFATLKDLYDQGEVAFVANMGALVEPITKEDYFAKPLVKELPPSLFAHNIMTRSTQNLHPQNTAAAGVLGRAVTAMRNGTLPFRSEMYSVVGTQKILEGGNPDFVSGSGITQFSQYDDLIADLDVMTEFMSQSPMAETYLNLLTASLNKTERVGDLFSAVRLNNTFTGSYLASQMGTVAKFIKLRSQLQTERDVFVTSTGGFDTHGTFDLDPVFSPIDESIATLRKEMQHEGIWDNVAVFTISEFGRTLTTNGAGTDHGWGGNYFLVGGGVNGGQILGHYPDRLTEDGSVHIGRGRLLPTSSWEAVWNGLLKWFGVEDKDFPFVLPNLDNFPEDQLFSESDLFRNR